MYRSSSEGLGFSLKPPSWLRNLTGQVFGGATQAQAAVQAVSSNYPAAPAVSPAGFNVMEPPGWLLPVGLGLAALLLLRKR